jgi:putative hydrolase of the HAD superfamily
MFSAGVAGSWILPAASCMMPAMAIRTVLFDAGNTLLHLDYEFIANVLTEHGQARSAMDIRVAEYAAKAAIDRELAPQLETPDSVEGLLWPTGDERPSYFAVALHQLGIGAEQALPILDALKRHNEEDCLWRVIRPGTAAVLDELRRRGMTLGVVSNADGRIEREIERRGLVGHFATVVDSHVVGVEKPDPGIFAIAMERLGAVAEETAYVGDVYAIDIVGARRAGMEAILVDTLDCYPGKLDCRRIRGLGELLDIFPAIA